MRRNLNFSQIASTCSSSMTGGDTVAMQHTCPVGRAHAHKALVSRTPYAIERQVVAILESLNTFVQDENCSQEQLQNAEGITHILTCFTSCMS